MVGAAGSDGASPVLEFGLPSPRLVREIERPHLLAQDFRVEQRFGFDSHLPGGSLSSIEEKPSTYAVRNTPALALSGASEAKASSGGGPSGIAAPLPRFAARAIADPDQALWLLPGVAQCCAPPRPAWLCVFHHRGELSNKAYRIADPGVHWFVLASAPICQMQLLTPAMTRPCLLLLATPGRESYRVPVIPQR